MQQALIYLQFGSWNDLDSLHKGICDYRGLQLLTILTIFWLSALFEQAFDSD